MTATRLRLRHALVAATLIAVAGCASSDSSDTPPKSGAADGASPAGVESETDFAKRMDQMRRAMENLPGEGADTAATAATPANDTASTEWTPTESSDARRTTANSRASGPRPVALDDDPAANATSNVTVATEPEWRPTPEQRRSQLVHELAAALRQEVAAADDEALGSLMRLAALDAIEPGVFNSYFVADGRSPESALTERQMAYLTRYRDMLEDLRAESGSQGATGWGVDPLVKIVGDAAKDMAELNRISIREAKLCARVETIGRYTELDRYGETYKFLASTGRHRAIVYVEPEGFGQREQTHNGAPGWQVEMEQDLLLYRLDEQADMLAWQLVGQGVSEFSRVRRIDFFLTTVIDLPPTLSVGKYRLKVLLRDRTSGAEAEKTLNIEVVGNRAALREG